MRARWNDGESWELRSFEPRRWSRSYVEFVEHAKAAPAPRINLLSYTGLLLEVPQIHRGRQQPWRFMVVPPQRAFDWGAMDWDTGLMIAERHGFIGYRWVP